MPTLGIIGCTVLSDELVYLVARDPETKGAVVIDNNEGRKLVSKLGRSRACERTQLVEVEHLDRREYEDHELVIWMNTPEMHNSQERMRNAMASEIRMMAGSVDAILLLYGQCRCQTLDIAMLEDETGVPILYLVDRRNLVVDDCISAIVGSTERYLRMMKEHKGAFFITPGYVDGYALKVEGQNIVELVEEIERMNFAFEAMGHPSLIKLDNNNGGGKEYHEMIDMFARTFDLEVFTVQCDMGVFEESYDWAKRVMRARTRGKEPVVVMSDGGDVLGTPPLSWHMWDEFDH